MKMFFNATRFLVCLMLLLPAGHAFAQIENTATIDCSGATAGAFTSFSQAILNSPDHTIFTVSGSCTDSIIIQNRNDLSFFATAPTTIQASVPDQPLALISGSQNIRFSGTMTMTGGQGIDISSSNNVSFFLVTVQNSGSFGINMTNSQVHFFNGAVSSNTRSGIVTFGGTFEVDGATISNNGRLGISASTTHLVIQDGNDLPTTINNNGTAGVQLLNTSHGDFDGNLQINNNHGFGLQVATNSALVMQGGTINGNVGIGVNCVASSSCEFFQAQINSNTNGGIAALEKSELDLDGSVQISGNTGTGILIDQSSSMASNGGDTISNNTGDALILNTLSTLQFVTPDTITATAGNLALNCNNGSLVTGDISTYKPKKCGAQFQAVPIH